MHDTDSMDNEGPREVEGLLLIPADGALLAAGVGGSRPPMAMKHEGVWLFWPDWLRASGAWRDLACMESHKAAEKARAAESALLLGWSGEPERRGVLALGLELMEAASVLAYARRIVGGGLNESQRDEFFHGYRHLGTLVFVDAGGREVGRR